MKNQIKKFTDKCQEMIDGYHKREGYHDFQAVTLTISYGKKYAKIIQNDTGISAWGFINMENGDILKSAGWSAPSKHARGNIYDKDMMAGVTVFGPAYLKRGGN